MDAIGLAPAMVERNLNFRGPMAQVEGGTPGKHRQERAENVLERIYIVYEDRASWIERVRANGYSARAARTLSQWLLPPREVLGITELLRKASRKKNVDVCVLEIDEFLAQQHLIFKNNVSGSIIWNITDGAIGFRGSHAINLALLHGCRYFGCPPFAQSIAQDKFKLFLFCSAIGVPCPQTAIVKNSTLIASHIDERIGEFFVKPNAFGNKIGIDDRSMCSDYDSAVERAVELSKLIDGGVIVQRFIDGPEIRVTYLNCDQNRKGLGYQYIAFDSGGQKYISSRTRSSKYNDFCDFKLNYPDRDFSDIVVGRIDAAVNLLAEHMAVKDYFTIDFRVDALGIPRLIDFNPGAFLYGKDVCGYTEACFSLGLGDALLRAIENSFNEKHPSNLGGQISFFV